MVFCKRLYNKGNINEMTLPRDMTIEKAISQIKKHQLTSRELVESCLDQIELRENLIHAWVEVYKKEALEIADTYDAAFLSGKWMGELHGIPIGVKDIIDVKGMWMRAGCDVYPAEVGKEDATVVQKLKNAGAIILGKTQTTAFANNDPTISRNPWNLDHSPGGSSSGSGAAVADRMCLAALGSQTGGSLIRPASYNGIVGFKPTYSNISLQGVIPVSWNLDHIGSHTRCVSDAFRLFKVMCEKHPNPSIRMPHALLSNSPLTFSSARPPCLGFIRGFMEDDASSEILHHMQSIVENFKDAGAIVVEMELPESFKEVHSAHTIIFEVDLATFHQQFYKSSADKYPPKIKSRIGNGMKTLGYHYSNALQIRKKFQDDMGKLLSSVDAGLMLSSLTTAPHGLETTGSAAANVPWSFSGFPAISLPSGLDSQRLPLGIQLVGPAWSDELIATVAMWCEDVLKFDFAPEHLSF